MMAHQIQNALRPLLTGDISPTHARGMRQKRSNREKPERHQKQHHGHRLRPVPRLPGQDAVRYVQDVVAAATATGAATSASPSL